MDLHFLSDPTFWVRWLQIVLIDLVLAGDNALVIALAVRKLPAREQLWGRVWGTCGAVILRLIFVAIITRLLLIPFLQLVGGLVLIWIAVKLVRPTAFDEEHAKPGASLREAIKIIIVADVAMSLDNVIAIAGIAKEGSDSLHGEMGLVIFGLLLSIPLVIFGSVLISKLMNRFRWVIWLGGGVLGHVAGKIIFQDPRVLGWLGVPATTGMPDAELARLLGAAESWVRMTVHGVPWVFAALLFALGAWWSRNQPATRATDEPRRT